MNTTVMNFNRVQINKIMHKKRVVRYGIKYFPGYILTSKSPFLELHMFC